MAYLSLYRKYRSQGFDEILGQKHVTQTLKNALASGKVAHAYLFTGPRGTGKTSTARVLAKALNCQAAEGPTPDPCGVCEACTRIRDGYSMDVMEIDAASTRGIDDIRDLREKVKFAPAQERVKVYVIDEVHQLTGEAFNALLKTLEEPPANVVFVLATTELHKVPATILSRCQRFDFRRGGLSDLKDRIASAAEAEGWPVQPEAVTALAIGANGGYRDALSLLEQVAAYAGDGPIDLESVNLVLGSVADEQLFAAVDAIAAEDGAACFRIVDEALASGVEVRQFLSGLRRRLRDLLMIAVGAAPEDASVLPAHRDRLEGQSRAIPTADLLWAMDQLNEAERDLRWAPQQRLLLETSLVRLATRAQGVARAATVSAPAPAITPSPARVAPPRETPPVRTPIEKPTRIVEASPFEDEAPLEEPPLEEPVEIVRPAGAPMGMGDYTEAWTLLLRGLKGQAGALLTGSRPVRFENSILVVNVPDSFRVEKANEKRTVLEKTFAQALGRSVPLKFESAPASAQAPAQEPTPAAPARRKKAVAEEAKPLDNLADLATTVFQGELVESDGPFTE